MPPSFYDMSLLPELVPDGSKAFCNPVFYSAIQIREKEKCFSRCW